MPIGGNECHDFAFTPPDAGTYRYQRHCMTMEQMAHCLTGVMVIAKTDEPKFNSEQMINLRDFRQDDDGIFLP